MRITILSAMLLATGVAAQNITAYEYWLDEGHADRTTVNVTSGQTIDLLQDIDVSAATLGHHAVHYRMRDNGSRWSSVVSVPFSRLVGGPYEVVSGEYWFDEAHEDRTPFNLGPGQIVTVAIGPDASGLARGSHKVRYRIRDNHGFWSSVLSKPFTVQPGAPHEIILLRYWSDPATTDPSDMTVVPITPAVQYLDIIDDVLFCNWSTTGQTNVYFQLKDNHGQWSSVLTDTVDVDMVSAPPTLNGPVAGPTDPAFGSTVSYTVPSAGLGATYIWTLPDGWTGASITNSITVEVGSTNNGSTLSVHAVNGCGESDPVTLDIVTGMKAGTGSNGIALFPNPTTGQFTLAAEAPITRVLVYSSTGQLVRDLGNTGADRIALDLAGEAPGLYTVRVFQGDRHRDVRVMVQQ